MNLDRLLRPRSIAVVGASERPGSYGGEALLNLRRLGFRGPVHGVNPRRREAHGYPCVPSVTDLPKAPDGVVVAIPAAEVPWAVQEIGAIGCGGAVVFAAGFAESAEGRALQERLIAAAAPYELPVCGPNGNGIVNLAARAALWGDMLAPREAGPVALVSQSGNLAVNALAARRGLRLHTVVSSGNQAVVGAADYVEAIAELGGARAFRALAEEAGAAWARDPHDLLELAKALAIGRRGGARAGGGVAVMTCSGGDASVAADL